MPKTYSVYIVANTNRALYIGLTSSLAIRVQQHKIANPSTYAGSYKINRLVYFENYTDVIAAIQREKQIKRWRREKKLGLIVAANPAFKELSLW